MNNYLQQSNFRPQLAQVPQYQGQAFRGAPPPPYPNIPQRPSMPAQLGNALTQMMQLKGMRAQNKLAEFQMQQAKAAQQQQQVQRAALQRYSQKVSNDKDLQAIFGIDPQLGMTLLKTFENPEFNIDKAVQNSGAIMEALEGGPQSWSTFQAFDPRYAKIPWSPEVVNQALSFHRPINRAMRNQQLGKDPLIYYNKETDEELKVYNLNDQESLDLNEWSQKKLKTEDKSAEEKAINARMKAHPDETYDVARANVAAGMKTKETLSPPEIYKRISQIEITRARLHAGESLTEEDYAAMPEGTAAILKAFGKAKPDPKTLKTADEALTAERQILKDLLPKEYRIQPPVEVPKNPNEYDVQRDPKTGRLFVGQ